jgi:hypothetical protein
VRSRWCSLCISFSGSETYILSSTNNHVHAFLILSNRMHLLTVITNLIIQVSISHKIVEAVIILYNLNFAIFLACFNTLFIIPHIYWHMHREKLQIECEAWSIIDFKRIILQRIGYLSLRFHGMNGNSYILTSDFRITIWSLAKSKFLMPWFTYYFLFLKVSSW